MALDSTVIFKGEIARACGGVEGGTEAFGDVSCTVSIIIAPTIETDVLSKQYRLLLLAESDQGLHCLPFTN